MLEQVSFLGGDGSTQIDPLFYVNRVVDCFFITDIYVQFHLSYFDEKASRRVVQLTKIRQRYLRGWFTMDVVRCSSPAIFWIKYAVKFTRLSA